ncbi:nicotinamide mononucleotide transporter [Acetobacteraceae bacterium]|nr:nicotinamide mononucleotide transporter [Acetobacteraceae bacterium]
MILPNLYTIELIAAINCAIGSTLLILPRISGWFFLLISAVLYAAVFGAHHLYANLTLQIIFSFINLYGWICWSFPDQKQPQKWQAISLEPLSIFRDSTLTLIGGIGIGFFLKNFSDDPAPWMDGLLSGFSLLAQYWMARSFICCWPLWIIVNSCYALQLLFWHLPFSAILFTYLALISVPGWRKWQMVSFQKSVT